MSLLERRGSVNIFKDACEQSEYGNRPPPYLWALLLICSACNSYAESLRLGTYDRVHLAWPKEVGWVHQAAANLGYNVQLVNLPPMRALEMSASGDLDGELLRQPSAVTSYPSLLQVSVPLIRFEYWVMIPEDKICPATVAEVKWLKPVGVLGMKFNDDIYSQSAVGFEQSINVKAAMRMLSAGRADFFVAPNKTIVFAKASSLGVELKPCLSQPFMSRDAFLFLHEKHRHIIPAFERELRALMAAPSSP